MTVCWRSLWPARSPSTWPTVKACGGMRSNGEFRRTRHCTIGRQLTGLGSSRYGYRTMALVVALLILAIIAMTIGQRSPKEYTQYLPLWVAVASLVSASWPQCEAGTRGWPRPNRSQDVDLEAGSGSISLQSGAAATERSARTVDQWLERDAAIRSNCSGVTCQIQHVGGFIGPNGDVPDGSEGSVTTAGLRRCLPSVNPNWGRQTLSFFPEEFQSRSRTPKQQTGTSQSRPEHGSSPRQSMQSARSDQPLLSESRVD